MRPPTPICAALRPIHRMTDRSGRTYEDTDPNRLRERVGKANELIETCRCVLLNHATCGLKVETKAQAGA